MDVRYINPFVDAVERVFATAARTTVTRGEPHLKDVRRDLARVYCATVLIRLTGTTTGAVAVRFTKPVAFALFKALIGEPARGLDAGVLDALREVTSMIVGNAKSKFPAGGSSISTPEVCRNGDPLVNPPVLVLPFDCGSGRFLVEAQLTSAAPPQPAAAEPVRAA